ncbi:hypothetical protein [Streptomyces buecherae]|uniref:DUF8175 domain-containing protein n=1 Tax=Streptomyces buecherae TaxID=2763006 RepID=A0A7H8N868_9ACTN|nr:hypothetical protein [Streptomyces buecherae]QKW50701.1 hypothetical protein HUT08_15450 [Streptomyces buecherae]
MSPHGDDHYDSYGGDHGPAGTDGRLTRTRLPDGDGDAFGTGRRPRPTTKPSRSLLTVVTVVVLLIAAIAFANRGGGDSDDGDGGGGSGDAKGKQAQSTAPTGERPVKGKDTTTGIATGFPRTEQGAQSAAANYAVALGSAEMYNRERRREIVRAVMAPSASAAFEQTLDKAYSLNVLKRIGLDKDGKAPEGLNFVSRTVPVGTKATNYSENTATVEVWSTGLSGIAGESSKRPVATDWFTVTLKLSWTGNDWKVLTHSLKDGPAPVSADVPASTAEEITGAVEGYGGFTYAR